MSRIQTVDYVEGAISRLFRLASVTATTASAAGALEIAGLDRDRAQPGRRADPQGRRHPGRRHVTEAPPAVGPAVRPAAGTAVRPWPRYRTPTRWWTPGVAAPRPTDAPGAPDPRADPLPARAAGPAARRVALGRTSGGGTCSGIGVPIALGVASYLTTSFRIVEGRVELRRGLLNKHVLSTPIDRVRTVDVSASLIHRVLGLTTVRIGTGTSSKLGDDELALDGVRVHRRKRCAATCCTGRSRPRYARRPRLRTTRGWSPGSSRGGSGTRRSPPLAWSSPRRARRREPGPRRARPVGPPPAGRRRRASCPVVPAGGGAAAGGRGDRGGVGDGGARLPGHQLRLHGHLHPLRPRLAPASRAVHDPRDEHGRQPAARGQPGRAARPAPGLAARGSRRS